MYINFRNFDLCRSMDPLFVAINYTQRWQQLKEYPGFTHSCSGVFLKQIYSNTWSTEILQLFFGVCVCVHVHTHICACMHHHVCKHPCERLKLTWTIFFNHYLPYAFKAGSLGLIQGWSTWLSLSSLFTSGIPCLFPSPGITGWPPCHSHPTFT